MLRATTTYMSHSLLAVELADPSISKCHEQEHYSTQSLTRAKVCTSLQELVYVTFLHSRYYDMSHPSLPSHSGRLVGLFAGIGIVSMILILTKT